MEGFFTVAQAAEYLAISEASLNRYRWKGNGPPFYKMGGSIRYDRAELEAWARARRFNSTSEAAS